MKKVILLLTLFIGIELEARVIIVNYDGTGDYKTIKEGVAAADSGDTVLVKKGLYQESPILLSNPLWLLGESMDSTIIDVTGPTAWGIIIGAEGCTIRSFIITGTGIQHPPRGILCSGTSPIITYNTFVEVQPAEMWAVICEGVSSPAIHYNNFYCAYGVDLLNDSLNVNAENNFWNTIDEEEIQKKIWDGNDGPGLGIVDYIPWLDESVTSIGENNPSLYPDFFHLGENTPNPFNRITIIHYQLSGNEPVAVKVKIYNVVGDEIKAVVHKIQKPGDYTVRWDGRDTVGSLVPSGLYFIRLETSNYSATAKLVLTRRVVRD